MSYVQTVQKLMASNFALLVQPLVRDDDGDLVLGAIQLPEAQKIDRDAQTGNLTWAFEHTDLLFPLSGLLARNPQQHRTRGGTHIVIADPGVGLVTVTYRVGIYSDVSSVGMATGVLHLTETGYDPGRYRQTLTLLRCDVLHLRDGTTVTP